jgi:hypothetical protein
VNPTQRRSAKILSREEAAKYFPEKDGTIVVANFSHQFKFWVAQVPVTKISRTILQVEYFPIQKLPIFNKTIDIAHSQFRFDFAEGADVLLTPQVRDPAARPKYIRLRSLLFSVENIGPYGDKFDFWNGMKNHYKIAYRTVSLADKYQWMITEQHHLVTQYQLKMSPEQAQSVLSEGLQRGTSWSTRRPYNSIEPNCVTEQFNIVDKVFGFKNYGEPFLPNLAPREMKFRRLIDKEVQLPSFGEEFPTPQDVH